MNIRTLILDDDPNSRMAAASALAEIDGIEIVGEFGRSGELFDFLGEHMAHLLFLDIELDSETGFTVARRLRREFPELLIVFLTGHSSYAIDGYDFQPVNFLTKPINGEKLSETVREVRRRIEKEQGQRPAQIMFRLTHGYRILDVRDISYIERENRKNHLHTDGETHVIAGYNISELEEMLAEHGFFRCHQSFIISLYRVTAVRDVGRQLYEVGLRGADKPIPVARGHYEGLLRGLRDLGIMSI